MRILTSLALSLSLLAVPVAASACAMEMDIDIKNTLVAKKGAPSPDAQPVADASALKALLAEIDAKMEAADVPSPGPVESPATGVATVDAPAAAEQPALPATSEPAPTVAPKAKKVARR